MISLDIYIIDIIPLNTCSQIKLFSIGYVNSKENIMGPLTKGLLRELVYRLSRRIGLKPFKMKICNDDNHN